MTTTSFSYAEVTHASRHRTAGPDPLSPSDIGAASADHTHGAAGATYRLAAAKALGVPIGSFNFTSASGSVTCRTSFVSPAQAITDLVLTFDNWTLQGSSGSGGSQVGGELDGANAVTIKATIETTNGLIVPVWFPGGVRTVTLDPGASVDSLRVAMALPPSTGYFVRMFTSYTPGTFPAAGYAPDAGLSGSGYSAGDTTGSTGAMTTAVASSGLFAPSVITARTPTRYAVVGIMGDSLSVGTGDSINNGGYVKRGLVAIPGITLGRGSERASTTAPAQLHARRFRYLDACTHVICQYGVNDIGNNQSLATIQASLVALWFTASRRGLPIYQTTITPSTGNDATKEAVRVSLNTWIRDGAPILNGVAVATGSSATGTLRAGAIGHPLTTLIEVADLAETARNSGVYKAGYSDDGTHPNAVGAAALAVAVSNAVAAGYFTA